MKIVVIFLRSIELQIGFERERPIPGTHKCVLSSHQECMNHITCHDVKIPYTCGLNAEHQHLLILMKSYLGQEVRNR